MQLQSFGPWLSIAGTAITQTLQGGTVVALPDILELDVELIATFAGGTGLTSIDFQLQVSDDGTNWEGVATVLASSGASALTQSIAAVAGTTVRNRMQLTRAARTTVRNAQLLRLAGKGSGVSSAGDSLSSILNYGD